MGGGVAGLAAGWVTKFPVFEAADIPGGICASYYIRPKTTGRLEEAPKDGESYRFERYPPFMQKIIKAGGLMAQLKKK